MSIALPFENLCWYWLLAVLLPGLLVSVGLLPILQSLSLITVHLIHCWHRYIYFR